MYLERVVVLQVAFQDVDVIPVQGCDFSLGFRYAADEADDDVGRVT